MTAFLKNDFLLSNETARKLYGSVAERLPIVDYHCHVSPKEIYEDKQFKNITEVWLSGDHYKWRLMRSNGIDEKYITGDGTDREKFQKFAETLPLAIGNPMYHWCHLELKNYFGFEGVLSGDTAEEVWRLTEEKLKDKNMSVRGIIEKSNVAFIGTTDDPVDNLEYHKKIKEEGNMRTVVAPSFRPDKALNIDKADWYDYIKSLSNVSKTQICGIESLKTALAKRMEYFGECGCKISDHGLDFMVFSSPDEAKAEETFKKAIRGETVTADETENFKTVLLIFCAKQYNRLGWVMQLHYNCLRNPNSLMFRRLGPDTGFDCILPQDSIKKLSLLLDALYRDGGLPKTVIYSLNPADNSAIDTLIGAFQGSEIAGKIQHGSAWWFNDNKVGMREQMTSLASLSLLGNFIGMLTDSRSFLSYTRHEYFRRILCSLIGEWVENGEYPSDQKVLEKIVADICYYNAVRYFGLEDKK